MKIHIIHVLYSFGLGGMEGIIASLISRMNTQFFSHSICVFSDDLASMEKIDNNEVTVRVIKRRFRHDPTTIIRLAAVLQRMKPDIVRTYNWTGIEGIIAAKLSGLKIIVHSEHGVEMEEVKKKKKRRVLVRRILLRMCAKVIAVSRTIEKWLIEDVWMGKDKIVYIPNGCDTDVFRSGAEPVLRAKLGISDGDVVVGTVGSLLEVKDQKSLIEAFAKSAVSNNGMKLLLVGAGPLREGLERLAVKLNIGDKTIFTGGVSDPSPYYRVMDIFALTSISENMPNVLLQAMATALPIIATDVGDIRYMLEGERGGIIVEPRDIIAIENGIEYFIDNPDLAKRKGVFARKRVEDLFNISATVNSYETLYASLRK